VPELCCPCDQTHKLWGEFWWVEGKYQWVFFDDLKTSETFAEQVDHVRRAVGDSTARIFISR
jgi:hypothetical protein